MTSHSRGVTSPPLLDETIGDNLDATAARFPDNEALVDVPSDRRWTYEQLVSRRGPAGARVPRARRDPGRPGRHLGAQLRRVGARAVRDREDRRDPGQRQPGLPHPRGRLRHQPVRHLRDGRGRVVQDQRLPRDARRGRGRVPDDALGGGVRQPSWDELLAGADEVSAEEPCRGPGGAAAGRPDQHPVHLGHDRLPQGRDAQPPQHPQQRLLRRRGLPLHRCRPHLHPGARSTTASAWSWATWLPRTHGACMVIPAPGFDPAATLRAVQDERCTSLYGVPTMFIADAGRCRTSPTTTSPALRTGIMAGSPCPVEMMRKVIDVRHRPNDHLLRHDRDLAGVHPDDAPTTPSRRRSAPSAACGPHLEIKIVDPETGETVPRGEPGELCTKGYSVMLGYWDNPEKTAEAIDDGWMHTGDLAVIDDEGYVKITGRIKDMVIRGGENIYPREIEEFLYTHPDIVDAQVIGVPDEKYGEELWPGSGSRTAPTR